MNDLRATEPARVLIASDGQPIVVPASVKAGVNWSMRKLAIARERGCSFDEAERLVQIEMALEAKE